MALKPCLSCGVPTKASRCPSCDRAHNPYRTAAWRHTSKRVRRRDRACVTCGSTEHLHAHHLIPAAEIGVLAPDVALLTLCASCHNHYEAATRAGVRTPITEAVDVRELQARRALAY